MKLIDKDKIVSEIKELIRANELYLSETNTDEIRFQKVGAYSVLNDLLHFIDTLEVKEVDLEKEINEWQGCEAFPEGVDITPLPKAMEIVEKTAKHFYELGLRSQKGE